MAPKKEKGTFILKLNSMFADKSEWLLDDKLQRIKSLSNTECYEYRKPKLSVSREI